EKDYRYVFHNYLPFLLSFTPAAAPAKRRWPNPWSARCVHIYLPAPWPAAHSQPHADGPAPNVLTERRRLCCPDLELRLPEQIFLPPATRLPSASGPTTRPPPR